MAKGKNICKPGTISPATAEDAARFLDAMYAARKKYWDAKVRREQRRERRKFAAGQKTLFTDGA